MTDPIADMLTRIRNASMVKKSEVVMPMSKMKLAIARILEKESWIAKAELIKGTGEKNKTQAFDQLHLTLKYQKNGKPVISFLKRVSKPGLRVYVGKDKVPVVLNNLGMAIISTPNGLLTDKEAREQKVGGELICEIY